MPSRPTVIETPRRTRRKETRPGELIEAALNLFSINAITEGADAQARTTVRLEEDGRIVDGQGSDTDTIVSASRAYVHALNKLIAKRERTVQLSPAFLTA